MKNLENEVNAMSLNKALEIATKAKKPATAEEEQELLVATLKIKSLNDLIAPAYNNATKVLLKAAKDNKTTIEGTTIAKVAADGKVTPMKVSIIFGPQTSVKEIIDWDLLKSDKHVVIEDDPLDPKVKHLSVGDEKDWGWFNAPSIQGNATAVAKAIASKELDGKYQTAKTTQKYTMSGESVMLENLATEIK